MGNWETEHELGPPPRKVSSVVKLGVLFGGPLQTFGWFWLGFTSLFVWVFGANADLSSVLFMGETEYAQGVCTGVVETSASVNEEPVMKYLYTFRHEGQPYEGVSYSTSGGPSQGQACTVEFPPGNPAMNRIEGLRRATFPGFVLLIVGIFPLVGVFMVTGGMVKGRRAMRLLSHGKLGEAKLAGKEPTNTSINEQTVMKLTFAFEVDGRTYRAYAKTHQTAHLEDEPLERILYLPNDPTVSILVDDMPGSGRVGTSGDLEATSLAPLKTAIVPLIVIAGNLFALTVVTLA